MTTKRRASYAKPKAGSHLVMVLPDLHFPEHDPRALRSVLKAHAILKPAKTVILGDWLDAGVFKSFPDRARFEAAQDFFNEEVKPCNKTLSQLERNTDEIIYIEGNHEWRVEKYLARGDAVVRHLSDKITPKTLLSENRKKPFKWIPYSVPGSSVPHYKIAKDLIAVHGWSHAKHASAKHMEIARSYSVVHGHTHRTQLHTGRNPIDGQIIKAWSPGCLSNLEPKWIHGRPTDWTQGIDLIYVTNDLKNWTNYTVTIQNGTMILPGGVKISA